jgi:nitronate monooxygenase
MWPDRRLLDLLGIDLPIVQAPMAGANGAAMAVAVSEAGGLGSLPCAMLDAAAVRAEVAVIKAATHRPFNLNFFCHAPPSPDADRQARWLARLGRYYDELGVAATAAATGPNRAPFDDGMCEVVEALAPAVVSFHFGLPAQNLVARVKSAGCRVLSSATSVAEALWLQARGCDAIIAQGAEAGGHRGMFLTDDVAAQPSTLALVPQVVDAVRVPVIAAGGIGDGRGIAAAFALGASGVQIGTGYLLAPESKISALHRKALAGAADDATALTNVFTGRPARGIVNRLMRELGPISDAAPAFPGAAAGVGPLRAKAEAAGSSDFTPLWSGQSARFCRAAGARAITEALGQSALARLTALAGSARESTVDG